MEVWHSVACHHHELILALEALTQPWWQATHSLVPSV